MIQIKHILLLTIAAPVAQGACATVGTQPHDMSASDHQLAATEESQQADQHAARYDPSARRPRQCPGIKPNVCWKDQVNPTAQHLRIAEEHRERAAAHRAASAALTEAEARSCSGISAEDRDLSPFAHKADIRRAAPLIEKAHDENGQVEQRTLGATVVFRAVPGMTAEWLQSLVDCHLARNAALGHDVPEMSYCPLVPKGVTAKARSVGDGFAVDIRGDEDATIQEIQRRVQRLASDGQKHPEHETWIQ